MNIQITPLLDINENKIIYSNMMYNQNKKYINLHYENIKEKIYFQTPKLIYRYPYTKLKNYNEIILILENNDKTNIIPFIDCLERIENKILNIISYNKNWFDDENKKVFNSIIKKNEVNTNYLLLKLLNNIQITDEQNNILSLDEIPINSQISLILNINSIWINDNNIGIYIKTVAIQVHINYKYLFIDFDDT